MGKGVNMIPLDNQLAPSDILSFDLKINISHRYKNITRHHGEIVPIIDWIFIVIVNDEKCDEDEVFVIDQFFESLLHVGDFPMFTCTCGIFGCGGYFVNVAHTSEGITWKTERTPFKELQHQEQPTKFNFTWEVITKATQQLLSLLEDLHNVHIEHSLKFDYDIKAYEKMNDELILFVDSN